MISLSEEGPLDTRSALMQNARDQPFTGTRLPLRQEAQDQRTAEGVKSGSEDPFGPTAYESLETCHGSSWWNGSIVRGVNRP
jgi:hypothetical protein